jgi:hypothetical protein
MSIKTICCVCHKTKSLNGWLDIFVQQYKSLSHGYCPECFAKTMRELELKTATRQGRSMRKKACDLQN